MNVLKTISTGLLAFWVGLAACRDEPPGERDTLGDSSGQLDTTHDVGSESTDSDGTAQMLELVIEQPLVFCGSQIGYAAGGGHDLPHTVDHTRRLTIMPGRYPLPVPVVGSPEDPWPQLFDPEIQDATEVPLSMVLEDRTGPIAFTVDDPIRATTVQGTYSVFEFDPQRLNVRLRGVLRMPNGERWSLSTLFDYELYRPDLQAVHVVGGDLEHAQRQSLSLRCQPEDSESGLCNAALYPSSSTVGVVFYECSFPWSPVFEWHVSYPAGTATFETQVTVPHHAEVNDTFPLVLIGARGVHEGTEWTQDDPLYRTTVPNALEHDPTISPFAVVFPEPIEGACGIATDLGSRMVGESYMGFPEVYTFDCDYELLTSWEADSVEVMERD